MGLLFVLAVAVLLCATDGQFFGFITPRFQCRSLFNFYPHESDCNRFYRCFWGQPHEFVCPSNTHWNQRILTCDHAYNVPCATAIVAEPIYHDWQPINNGFVKKPLLPPRMFETSFVKETVAQPPTLIGGQNLKDIVPPFQSPEYKTHVVKTPIPSSQHSTVDTEIVKKIENTFSEQNDYLGQNNGFIRQNVFPRHNTGYVEPNNRFPKQNIFPNQNMDFLAQNNRLPRQDSGFMRNNAGLPTQNNGYLYNNVNQPYRKSMWHASAGSTGQRFRKSQFLNANRDSNTNNPRPNIKFVKVQDPVVGRFFGSKSWKK